MTNIEIKYSVGDKVRTKIHYENDSRTEVEAIIDGVDLDRETNNIKYLIRFEPEEYDKKRGCAGCTGYVNQDDILGIVHNERFKVFISHPMSGLTEEEVMKLRDEAKLYLKENIYPFDEIEIIDNYTHPDAPENAGRLWHLGRSIQMMEEADIIFFFGNWGPAKGCIIERLICSLYGLNSIVMGEKK